MFLTIVIGEAIPLFSSLTLTACSYSSCSLVNSSSFKFYTDLSQYLRSTTKKTPVQTEDAISRAQLGLIILKAYKGSLNMRRESKIK